MKIWALAAAAAAILAAIVSQYTLCRDLLLSRLGICWLGSSGIAVAPARNLSLLWMAPFFSPSGYGSEALSYVQSLRGGEISKIKIVQHGDLEDYQYWNGLPRETKKLLLRMNGEEIQLRESIVICHSEPGAWFPPLFSTVPCPPGDYREPLYVIGRTMFETDRLSLEHVKRCNAMDEVWVPSQFNVETFASSGVLRSKLVKVPQAVDTHFFDPGRVTPLKLSTAGRVLGRGSEDSEFLARSSFVFLSIFKWETRKGWDVLLQAFLEEFSADDDVALYVLTSSYHSDGHFGDKVLEFTRAMGLEEHSSGWPRVYIRDAHVPQVDLPRLYKAASAFVLPSRGEGWGRPHVEAMAMELPVIATNWSGSTEFMTPDNSYGLAVERLSEIKEGAFKGHKWAEPSVSELRSLMRRVFTYRDEAGAKGVQARKDMVTKYSPEKIADVILKELLRIQKQRDNRMPDNWSVAL
ncbi:uncharacterized protein LOC112341740 [Selaginella moellendorffii]|uniref:uncharacterized protein LOC112341740 n=1 Tax=Selaginella moellendorffii TaxID=88036 RepID=UPI000D1C8F08|nr:uncharacterized protein LOC112341740 [Selaginella moellendorffii]|eukprot:XP_024518117.1 uncharacterized protein LOC112341740 [Selaginella moellendorffii]